MADININISLDMGKMPNKPQPMIEGHNAADMPNGKMEQGYDITGSPEDYKKWTGKMTDYQVKEGDTLESIAKKFKIKPNELALLNRKEGNMLSDSVNVGQRLKVPLYEDANTQEPDEKS